MTPDFSEFSYGFALLNEIVSWSPLAIAPILPSLIEEAKGGYDVKLDWPGVPFYLQFKRADFVLRRTKTVREKTKLNAPHYRFKIMDRRRSRQHQLLYELDRGNNTVVYAAPRFHGLSQLNSAWSAKRVARQSIFVRPSVIGELDDNAHSVAYNAFMSYVLSEPRKISAATTEDVLDALRKMLHKQSRPIQEMLPALIDEAEEAEQRANLREEHREEQREIEKRNRRKEYDMRELIGKSTPRTTLGASPTVVPRPFQIRAERYLSGPHSELRKLAEIAAQRFDALLFIVQARKTTSSGK